MKPSQEERDELRLQVVAARAASSLTNAEIARATGVDPGQTSKICRGQFDTLSDSVLKILKALGVRRGEQSGLQSSARAQGEARRSAAWRRLENSMRRAWDETPDGADRLARVIDAVAEVVRR